MKISKEVRIGIVVVTGLVILLVGLNFLKGQDIFFQQRKFVAIYNSVNGLSKSNPVIVNGLKVGQVQAVELNPSNPRQVIVTFLITNSDLSFGKKTIARIISADLLGSKSIELQLDLESVLAENGDTLNTSVEEGLKDAVNQQIAPLKNKAEGLISSIDSLVTVVKSLLDENTVTNIETSFRSVKNTALSIERATHRLDKIVENEATHVEHIIENASIITQTLSDKKEVLDKTIDNFGSISTALEKAQLDKTIEELQKAISETSAILAQVNSQQGSLGKLVYNDSLYDEATNSLHNFQVLLEDIKLHPKRYVQFSLFGGGDKSNFTPAEEKKLKKVLKEKF